MRMHVDNTNRFDTLPNLSIYKSMGFHSNTVLEVETRMHLLQAAFWVQHRSQCTTGSPFLRMTWFVEMKLEQLHISRILLTSFLLISKACALKPTDSFPLTPSA